MIISITVVAIVIMAIAIPIFTDATKPASQLNDAKFAAVSSGEPVTLTMESNNETVTIKSTLGTSFTYTRTAEAQIIPIMSDRGIWTVTVSSSSISFAYVTISSTSSASPFFPLTFKKGAFDWAVFPAEGGDLGCINSTDGTGTQGAWANSGQKMYWGYQKAQASSLLYDVLIGWGDPWDAGSINVVAKNTKTKWTGSPSSVEVLEDGPRAKKFGGLVFDDPVLSQFTEASLVFAPLEYIPNTSSGGSSDQVNTLVNLIPMIMVAGLVVAVAASYVRSKME